MFISSSPPSMCSLLPLVFTNSFPNSHHVGHVYVCSKPILCVGCIRERFINWVTLLFGMHMPQLTVLIAVGKNLKSNKELGKGAHLHHAFALIIGGFPTHIIRKVVT